MKDETVERRRTLLWALPASLIAHALITAFLVYGLPSRPQQPPEEQAVNVALVPPPDPPKPKPAPAPPPKKPPEQKVEQARAPQKPSKIEVLKPVFQFGDKDTGPRKSPDGASAQDNSPSPAKDDDSKPPVVPRDAEPAQDVKKQAEDLGNQEAAKQQAAALDADKEEAAAPATPLAAAGDDGEIELPKLAQAPEARPENAPKTNPAKVSRAGGGRASRPKSTDVVAARAYSGLPGVRKLYSKGATGDAFASTAMDGMTRDQRVDNLCISELQLQLQAASYFPDLVLRIPVKTGNVFDVPNGTFHAQGKWYGVSFRCEIDTDATRVLSLTLRAVSAIPSGEWARLGLPDLR